MQIAESLVCTEVQAGNRVVSPHLVWIILNVILKTKQFASKRPTALLEDSSPIANTAQCSIINEVEICFMKLKFIAPLITAFVAQSALAAVPKKMNAFTEGDRVVYTRLVEAYRKNNLAEVQKQRALLEKNYPASVHLDNAYYLTGMLEFQNQYLGEAVRSFNT